MIPSNLQSIHFQKAIKEIDENGTPASRQSYKYDLLINGKKYPPKYTISIANKYINGIEWDSEKFNAVEAKNYFIQNGYLILDKNENKELSKIETEDIESKYAEGKEKYKLHRSLERDTSLSKKIKEKRLHDVGELRCDVCNFSFSDVYGELGAGFIEAHHTIPVSEIKGEIKTTIDEIALVCSNCHKMIHRSNQLLSIEELKNIINNKVSQQ